MEYTPLYIAFVLLLTFTFFKSNSQKVNIYTRYTFVYRYKRQVFLNSVTGQRHIIASTQINTLLAGFSTRDWSQITTPCNILSNSHFSLIRIEYLPFCWSQYAHNLFILCFTGLSSEFTLSNLSISNNINVAIALHWNLLEYLIRRYITIKVSFMKLPWRVEPVERALQNLIPRIYKNCGCSLASW